MAVRKEDLIEGSAVVYAFPPIRARRARRQEILRRRLALTAVGVVVAAAGLFATGPNGVAPARAQGPRAVRVEAGETLWMLAERHAPPGTDTRAYLDAILELNGVSALVEPGTRIRLP